MKQAGELYPPVISAILENLASGDTTAAAVNKGFKAASYEADLSDVTVGNTLSASGFGLGEQLTLNMNLAPDYFLFTNFANGVNLSDTIYSGEAQQAVKGVLNNYFKFKGNAQELTRKLTNINRFPNTDIPRELTKLIQLRKGFGDLEDSRAFQKQVKKAYASIFKLDAREVTQTRQLKKAYEKLILATKTGDVQKIEKALDYAFGKKVNYINSRVARTEFKRSYDMSINRQIEEDELAVGFEWVLSPAHPRIDYCDLLADIGFFKKGTDASSHPNCFCSKIILYEMPKGGSYTKEKAVNYIDGLSEKDRKQVVGAKYSQHKKDYEKGLKNQGIMARSKLYAMIEGLEGGESIRDSVKAEFQEADKRAEAAEKKYKEINSTNTGLMGEIEDFKAKAGKSDTLQTENSSLSKQMQTMSDQLATLTKRAEDADAFELRVSNDKKDTSINKFFSDSVSESFGAKNTAMSVGFAMSQGDISYTESNEMSYKGKLGDEGIELFKSDNQHLINTIGTGTTGGETPPKSDLSGMSVEELLKNPQLLKK